MTPGRHKYKRELAKYCDNLYELVESNRVVKKQTHFKGFTEKLQLLCNQEKSNAIEEELIESQMTQVEWERVKILQQNFLGIWWGFGVLGFWG